MSELSVTSAPPAPPGSPASASRDVQRQSLEQIVTLSIECTADEQRIDQQYEETLARAKSEHQKKIRAAEERHQKRLAELSAAFSGREEAIQSTHQQQLQALEEENQATQQRLLRERKEAESALKKQVEEACWHAESLLVTVQMESDTEEEKWKEDEKTSQEILDALDKLEKDVHEAMSGYDVQVAAEDLKIDAALKHRLATESPTVLVEHRQQAIDLLEQLKILTKPRPLAGAIPVLLIGIFTLVSGAGVWMVPQNESSRLIGAGVAALAALAIGIVLFIIHRYRTHAKLVAQVATVYIPLTRAIAIARRAARVDNQEALAAQLQRVTESKLQRDLDISNARSRGEANLAKIAAQYRATLTQHTERHDQQLFALEQEKDRGLESLRQKREKLQHEIDEEAASARNEAQTQFTQITTHAQSTYDSAVQNLTTRWSTGLRAVTELMAVGTGIDPQLVDWNSPAWRNWKAPAQFGGQVRFGEMKIDLAQLTDRIPKRLQLPESFSLPAMLVVPSHASLLVETDHAGRAAAIEVAQMVMARILTQMPAGRAKFTIFDPVGLGQSFAGFMHLADHDESLVGSRIWTEREHIEQRLADLTEHMETVIQKYLRNEYETIDQYNAQAGELAEPTRFLVIADFPTGFEAESLRRLASIATTGPRCGVYTIILRDTRQPLPAGSRMEEIIARSVHLTHKNGVFSWDDKVFKRFPLTVDRPPDEKVLTFLMDLVGKAAKEAKRVEVPFESIAPPADQFWSLSSKNDLRVPIGKSGATRLQSFRLGVGVAQHALVAGKTGSGKSNLMHTIVTNLAMWYGPDEVEFYLVDFKKGVEFKTYATTKLPHARAIAVESDREFGISVLQRVDAELTRRGTLFRDAGVQDLPSYRDRTNTKLPRTILLIDEFQEFFSEDDKLSQEASGLLDRLVRQGRAFGVHVVLGSQTIGGNSGLARSTLGQIAVRVALQCTEADSQMILGDNNSAARLLTRPGEAIYNDAGGLVEANSPFQIAYLPDDQREHYLHRVHDVSQIKNLQTPTPIVFEGNSAAGIRNNPRLMALLQRTSYPPAASNILAYIGEPVAIKEPTAISFKRQSGANVLMVGQQEESAIAIVSSMLASIAAQQNPADASFFLLDGTPADSPYFGLLERVAATLPNPIKIVPFKTAPDAINDLATLLKQRQADESLATHSVYLLVFGLQRYRFLRHQEDDFSFSRSEEPAPPKPDKQFSELLSEGPALGIHTAIWADTPITIERTLERGAMRQFDFRLLFQMSASDSSNLIDSPLANRLGSHRALLYSEEQGTFEKCRPYAVPDDTWLAFLTQQLKNRTA